MTDAADEITLDGEEIVPRPSREWEAAHPDWQDLDPADVRWRPDRDGKYLKGKGESQAPRPASRPAQAVGDRGLVAETVEPVGGNKLPPRRWAFGNFLMFGHTACLAAVDGGGKGSLAVGIMLSMVSGRPLLGFPVWRSCRVAIISYEDHVEEWHRRLAAACEVHGLDYVEMLSSMHFLRVPDGKVCLAGPGRDGPVFPDGEAIVAKLKELGVGLLVIDPLAHAHGFDDENSNALIAKLAFEVDRIATMSDTAILALHHLRKGSTGHVDDIRGAGALRATFRSSWLLDRMSENEAKTLGVTEHWRYSRIAASKDNYAPPADRATWFKLESVRLGNGTEEYPDGDTVQVTVRWMPPALFGDLGRSTMADIFDAIRKGPASGECYSPHRQARHWVGHAVAANSGQTPEQAKTLVKRWLDNGVLVVGEYYNATSKRRVENVTLNEAKAAEILRDLGPGGPSESPGGPSENLS